MASLKKYYKVQASSLLESVVALCIIAICLYISLMVYVNVFSDKTTAKFYNTRNKIQEAFFIVQLGQDSLLEKYNHNSWIFEKDHDNGVNIKYQDSSGVSYENFFYLNE